MLPFPKRSSGKNRRGSAVTAFIVIVVFIVIVFIIKSTVNFGLPICENPASSHQILPWQEAHRIVSSGETPNTEVSDEQPAIDQRTVISATIKQSNTAGDFYFTIGSNGTVTGTWNADYNKGDKPRMNYVMKAKFKGNIDPDNIYFDENGEDPGKLFMIAKGEIYIMVSNFDTESVHHNVQDIWVSGWIDKDLKAEGEMVLITGRKTYQIFNWKSVYLSKRKREKLLREGSVF